MSSPGSIRVLLNSNFKEENFTTGKEVIVVYYHVFANDIDDAISIAKRNPEFEYSTTARVEVRPIKMKEEKNERT